MKASVIIMKLFNGNRLKSARQYRGLTVEELAQKIRPYHNMKLERLKMFLLIKYFLFQMF